MGLKKGETVEVYSDEEGFKGSWYPATLIRKAGSGFFIEFKDLVTGDEKSKLREKVDADQIRPVLPSLNRQHFMLHEIVDAYVNDGWWTGTIDIVLADNNYIVLFSHSGEKLEYNVSQLRLHLDWVDDKWLQSSEDPMPSTCETGAKATLKQIELHAYHSVLKALYLQEAHTWKIEVLLAELREVLHVSNEESASELRRLIYGQNN